MPGRSKETDIILGVGDLVRVKGNENALGIVTKKQFLLVEKVHPITRTEPMRAVVVRWLDRDMREDSVYLESILELVQVAKANNRRAQ
tara:strand:- start:403 stop:666 length:264 start_codon:yes stop_codon:yes gene_type:complete